MMVTRGSPDVNEEVRQVCDLQNDPSSDWWLHEVVLTRVVVSAALKVMGEIHSRKPDK